MVYFHIVAKDLEGAVLHSNMDEETINDVVLSCTTVQGIVRCKKRGEPRRQIKVDLDRYTIYLCTYGRSFDKKKFRLFRDVCIYFTEEVFPQYLKNEESELKKVRRLKHNLITHSTKIASELYQIIPQESLIKGGQNQLEYITGIISERPRKAASHLLSILKASTLMKAEFDVYDMLNTTSPKLEIYTHSIHKIVLLTLNPFWIDLMTSGIKIDIGPCHGKIVGDYKSIFVILSHVFDNATKYCAPNSRLIIEFDETQTNITLILNMISLKVEEDEQDKMFKENYSGLWPSKLEINGDGVGMFIIKKLIELNNGMVYFETDKKLNLRRVIDEVPYCNNVISLTFPKALSNIT